MADSYSVVVQVQRLWAHLKPQRRRQLLAVCVLMILASFAELLSLSIVVPFLAAITSPDKIFYHELAQPLIKFLQIRTPQDLLLPLTQIFLTSVILAGLVRILLLWAQTRVSVQIGVDLSLNVFERTLYQPYEVHISRNGSAILTGIQKAEQLVGGVIQPVLMIVGASIILTSGVVTLIAIQPIIACGAFIGFGLVYLALIFATRRRTEKNSEIIGTHSTKLMKTVQESLGGIREVIISGTQPVSSKAYLNALNPIAAASIRNQFIGGSPRFGVEALGVVLIVGLAYFTASSDTASTEAIDLIPVLGAFALGAQRLLPIFQQLYLGYVALKGSYVSTADALNLLDQPMPKQANIENKNPIPFLSVITLHKISYRYSSEEPWVLRNLSLEIRKGSRIGIIGSSGSGKTTLLDILMGLLYPTEGFVSVDDLTITPQNISRWHATIAHVPQTIFLSDASIAENIAFGVPVDQIDIQRLENAANQAQLGQTIKSWRNGYSTIVGERGIRLSGGQLQRIGIARALYRQATVLVLDEATSALDHWTETALMEVVLNIRNDITILIATHRITTLKNCNEILEISKSGINFLGGYDQLIQSTKFKAILNH